MSHDLDYNFKTINLSNLFEIKTFVLWLITPHETIFPLDHISYTCTRVYPPQNSIFLLLYTQVLIIDVFKRHISERPRYWSLNVNSTESNVTDSGLTTFTVISLYARNWNKVATLCSMLIVSKRIGLKLIISRHHQHYVNLFWNTFKNI